MGAPGGTTKTPINFMLSSGSKIVGNRKVITKVDIECDRKIVRASVEINKKLMRLKISTQKNLNYSN